MAVAPHVAIVRWPEEASSIDQLRAIGVPRLLLVAPDAAAPDHVDRDEDWIRPPLPDDDVRTRAQTLARRAAGRRPGPVLKGDGRIVFGDRWTALSETEEALARVLSDRFGEVVDPTTLASVSKPEPMTSGSMRIHIMKLRK